MGDSEIMMGLGIAIILLGGVLLSLGIVAIIEGSELKEGGEVTQGDCFDRYGNKINGVTCDVETAGAEQVFGGFFIVVFAIIFIIAGFILIWTRRDI